MAKMKSPVIHVELDDGTRYDLTTTPSDQIRYELTAAKEKWPGIESAPIMWSSFLAWSAAKRTAATDRKWEAWRDAIVALDLDDDDADQADEADPTAAASGRSSS